MEESKLGMFFNNIKMSCIQTEVEYPFMAKIFYNYFFLLYSRTYSSKICSHKLFSVDQNIEANTEF